MADAKLCPNCGAKYPVDSAEGKEHCPQCSTHISSSGDRPSRTNPETISDFARTVSMRQQETVDDRLSTTIGNSTSSTDETIDPGGNRSSQERSSVRAVRYFGDYEIDKELGRGGMGVVYKARQVSLNRPVALKMIKAGVLADESELRRFQNEAEAVALLDHPGIVPVYEVGDHDGQRYFSMRLIDGGNLAEELGKFENDPRATAALLVEIAEAVQHAHSRGILHRDLKPANILIDSAGHPHITDFGLAKRIEDDLEMTATGQVMGTPAYLSPEQALGHKGSITTATDVYGLGAIFYALLTGKAPFTGETVFEMLDAVRAQTPERPTKYNARIPRDLETIALKCLEKDPRRRYSSAQGIADDLRNWLNSRPISARRVSASERAWLWCKRRPTVAGLAATAVLASVCGITAVIAVQARANQALMRKNDDLSLANSRITMANSNLFAANERVKERFELANDAIRLFEGEVGEDLILKEDQFKPLRDRLLRSAAAFYTKLEELLKDQPDDASRKALGDAYFQLGELTEKISDQAAALEIHRKALAVRRELSSLPKAETAVKLDMARSLKSIGMLQKKSGDVPGAKVTLEEGMRLAKQAATDSKGNEEAQRVSAMSQHYYGTVLEDSGEHDAALALNEQVLGIRQKLADARPDDSQLQMELANTYNNMGLNLSGLGKKGEALDSYRRAEAIYQKLADTYPNVPRFRKDLADTISNLQLMLSNLGKTRESLEQGRRGQAILEKLIQENPSVTDYRRSLAMFHHNCGARLRELGDNSAAIDDCKAAVEIQEKLYEANPTVTHFQQDLANTLGALAVAQTLSGDNAGAKTTFRRGLEIKEKLVAANPTFFAFQSELVTTSINFAEFLRKQNDFQESRRAYDLALGQIESVLQKKPGNAEFSMYLAYGLRGRGLARLGSSDAAGAEADVRRSMGMWESKAEPDGFESFQTACCHIALAKLAGLPGSSIMATEATGQLDKAMVLLRKASEKGFRDLGEFRAETSLSPELLTRADFKAFMDELAAPAKPKVP
ncbi:protein kinase [bacterium]|nr:protein kinase [bacterium]